MCSDILQGIRTLCNFYLTINCYCNNFTEKLDFSVTFVLLQQINKIKKNLKN